MMRRPVLCAAALGLLLPLLAVLVTSTTAEAQARYPVLYTNGSRADFTVQGGGTIRIDARAAYCRGFPTLRVWIDGKLDRTIRLNQRKTKTYQSAKSYAVAKHRVALILRKDKKVRKKGSVVCNRRARIMKVAVARPGPTPPREETDGNGTFTVAVIGDTQNEVIGYRTNFVSRTRWLVEHRAAQDLRFVAHTGDLTNFGWVWPRQYAISRAAMEPLTAAGVPWQVSAGNHDTRAVGWDGVPGSRNYGGAAYVGNPECVERLGPAECVTKLLVRKTDEFIVGLPGNPSGGDARGHFETDAQGRGKPENSYVTFAAEGRRWLVLNLELWPRRSVVAWAQQVVASHPDHNVIIQTHSYLTRDGQVNPGDGGYGATSGTYLESQVVSKYRNVVMVLSGHTGLASHRAFDYGTHRVVAYLGNEGAAAVSRLIKIDTRRGTAVSRYWTNSSDLSTAPSGTTSTSGLAFR